MSCEFKAVVLDRLSNTILLANDNQLDHCKLRLLLAENCKTWFLRAYGIRWMLKLCVKADLSTDTRDTSVQVFDKFLSLSLLENSISLADTQFVSLAAAASVVLSSKMHDSLPLRMSEFAKFNLNELVAFEQRILFRLDYDIVPLGTPISFVRHLLEIGYVNDVKLEQALCSESSILIGMYWESNDSLLYSPAVIAFASLVIAFSKFALDCSEWLDSLPDICFHGISSTISNNVLLSDGTETSFDRVLTTVDRCINSMKSVLAIRHRTSVAVNPSLTVTTTIPTVSPTSALTEEDADISHEISDSNSDSVAVTVRPTPSPIGVEELSNMNDQESYSTNKAQKSSLKRSYDTYSSSSSAASALGTSVMPVCVKVPKSDNVVENVSIS